MGKKNCLYFYGCSNNDVWARELLAPYQRYEKKEHWSNAGYDGSYDFVHNYVILHPTFY